MIIETSALVAIVFGETEADAFRRALMNADDCRMSVASFLEAAIVVERRQGPRGGEALDMLLDEADIELVAVTVEQARAARQAWRRFGKSNHPAGLNFGDCFAYALAETTGEPLLFKGDDFALTDIQRA